MRRVIAALAIALAGLGSAQAQTSNADWLRKPTRDQLLSVWPPAALKRQVKGSATVSCTVTVQGALRDCKVTEESPPGMGFGSAALALTPQFLMRPALKNGVAVEAKANIPIVWAEVPSDVADTITRQPEPYTGSRLASVSVEQRNANKVLSNIPWTAAPSVADVRAAYPAKARSEKKDGHTTLDCVFNRRGGLSDCRPIFEEPRGYGFDRAAERLAEKFTGPATDAAGGLIAGAHTQIVFSFAASGLDADTPAIGKPHWMVLPTYEEFNAAFPSAAAKAGMLKARVVLKCKVAADGALTGCAVESEDPSGYGFGPAAASLAGKFRLSVWTAEGLPVVGGSISAPIRWELAQVPQATKP
ncbi:TonB family protein [Phenylobacterium sp.]|uniref:TonB family protein n=1 Tax=Phenylobacterium sp. TaxID=1871053 RepID=UPI002DE314C1|nr:TonB family protein [Phenylobacterium sp.]